jgi:hypothetical protein
VALFNLKSPISILGFRYSKATFKFDNSGTLNVSGRIYKSFTQNAKSVTETYQGGSFESASSAALDMTSFMVTSEYRQALKKATLIGGFIIGMDFNKVSGIKTMNVDLNAAPTFGILALALGYTF